MNSRKRLSYVRFPSVALIILITTFAILGLNPSRANASTQTPHAAIFIRGDGGFTTANGVTGGTGTASDPYVIQGWDMISSSAPSYACVEVANTTAYFSILNVHDDCPNYNNYAYSSIGLFLQNVTHGKIQSSYIAGNSKAAVISSSTNLVLYSNTFGGGVYGGLTMSADVNTTLAADTISGNVVITSSRNFSLSGDTISGDLSCSSFGGSPCNEGPTLSIDHSSIVTISGGVLTGTYINGVLSLSYISGLQILNNTVHCNICYAVSLDHTNNTVISENRVSGGGTTNGYQNWDQGIVIYGPVNNLQVTSNNVTQEAVGIRLSGVASGSVYHNDLTSNTIQASDDNPGKNQWDNGYPSGGNYWSDFTGVDNCSGPQQNICPNPDGIGDTPYNFTSGQDHYPLMKPFVTGQDPSVSISSTVSFQGVTVTVSGTLSISSGTISGSVFVAATNSSSGTTLFSKTYTITSVSIGKGTARFLLNVGVSPFPLSANIVVSQSGGVWSASVGLTRQIDILAHGTVDITDLASIAASFKLSVGTLGYNPSADIAGDGTVDIVDLATAATYFGATSYS